MTDEDARLWREETGIPEFKRGRGAPKGNRNAAKAPDAPRYTGQITLRLTPELKGLVDDAAGVDGANAWIRRAIEERLDREKSASVP